MMHQNELRPESWNAESATERSDPGSGNRESEASAKRRAHDFYNEWDGGGAGGAHRRQQIPGTRGAHTGKGPKGYRRSDLAILENVHRELTNDDMLDASDIQVEVSEAEVTLTGFVDSRSDKRRAERLVDDVSGVADVHNALSVRNR